MPITKSMSMDRLRYKNDMYEELADASKDPAKTVKITPKAKGQLANGFSEISMPAQVVKPHVQTKSERASVGSRWPGPKGRVGKVLHGKASPSSEESFLKQRKNHISGGK